MSNSKLAILILMGLAAGTFGASYGLSLWLKSGPAPAAADTDGARPSKDPLADGAGPGAGDPAEPESPTAHLQERHLMALVRQVRAKLDECRQREKDLQTQEQRLKIAREDLRREAQQLETLRARLAASAAKLKEARNALEASRLAVRADEQANLKHTAEIYDAMDAEAAADIIESMCKNNQDADAVKILYFMEERSVAKLLSAISDKEIVGRLCEQMKRVHKAKQEG